MRHHHLQVSSRGEHCNIVRASYEAPSLQM